MSHRRPAIAGVLVVLLLLAGCAGSDGPASAPGGANGPGAAGPTDPAGSTGGTPTEAVGAPSQWERFSFDAGEYYRYRITDRDDEESATVTWEVLAVDGSEVTAEVTFDDGTTSFARTITGENATILWDLRGIDPESEDAQAAVQAAAYLSLGPFSAMTEYFASRDFQVGNTWRLAGSDGTGYLTAAVEGRDRYAGQECYVATVRYTENAEVGEDDTEYVSCIAPDASLSFYAAHVDATTGEAVFEIELMEYRGR